MPPDEVKNDAAADALAAAIAEGEAAAARMDPAPRGRMTSSGARLIVATFAAGCIYFLAALPRPVLPREGPAIALAPAEVRAQLDADARAAAELDESAALTELAARVDAQRRLEAGGAEAQRAAEGTHADRMGRLEAAAAALREEGGEEALDAFVASEAEGLAAALQGALAPDAEAAALGSFPRMLARYGLAREGALVAPRLVTRSLFKATVNGLLQRELTAGFSAVELQAYWGWLAFSEAAPVDQRRGALTRFREAGGDVTRSLELEAWLAFRSGTFAEAAELYERLADATGSQRARNHALALVAMY